MAGVPLTPAEVVERKTTAAVILGAGIGGFLLCGLVALLLSLHHLNTSAGIELLVAGFLGVGVAIFLCVALTLMWFEKAWLVQENN